MVVNFHLYSSIALPTERELPVSIGWKQVGSRASPEALKKSKTSVHAAIGIKVANVVLVTFVNFVTKVTVVNRKVDTYDTRDNKCKHWTRKISNFGRKKKNLVTTVVTKVVTDVCRSFCNMSKFNQNLDFCADFNKINQCKI